MRSILLASLLAAGIALPAAAEIQHYQADLKTATEVPPKTGNGSGKATATLDTTTRQLTYDLTFKDLSGPATMAHFHGPAAVGVNAPPVVTLPMPVASPYHGTATLTEAQMGDLQGGNWYVNVHTAANPGGEIRGQLVKAP